MMAAMTDAEVPIASLSKLVDHLFRSRAGQMVSYLTRLLGSEHLDLAEEVVQESLLKALQVWPHTGIPDNPSGWLFRVARNAAVDAIRHRSYISGEELHADELAGHHPDPASLTEIELDERLRDDELQMVLMCCHPGLSRDARVALSLKTVGGFSTREIARAFLSEETAVAQRLVRAKRQLREQGIGFEMPRGMGLEARLDSALEVLYLMFNEGYGAQSGEDLVRHDLCREALRLGQLLAGSSVATPTVNALVALMAFQAARLPARVDAGGELVLLEDQDRSLWDQALVGLGFQHFDRCAEGAHVSAYHVQAAIAATHARARSAAAATDWPTILHLYDQLMEIGPSPVVALNRAVAVAKVSGVEAALSALRPLAEDRSLRNYYLLPAVQGHLLLESGDREAAAHYFRQALSLPCSDPEKRFLQRKLKECEPPREPQLG